MHMQRTCCFAGAGADGAFVAECSSRIPVIAKLKGALCFCCCQVRTDLLQILNLTSSTVMTEPGKLCGAAKLCGFAYCFCMVPGA